ncbi:MAG: toll/interleukin-1 receptor domain-containing protein [Thermodesulfobacteriota bacterium]
MGKVFLSYSHTDEEFVIELYKRLVRDGVDCFFDKESIHWGDNWVVALEEGIKDCDEMILVLSPDFIRSEWTKLERTSVMAGDPSGLEKKLRPLLLEPCGGDILPPFLKPIQSINVSSPAKFEKEYPKICSELGGTITKELSTEDRSILPPTCNLPKKHRMPYRSLGDKFVGRVRDLWDIHDILRERTTAVVEGVGVVMGTGGLGKTQLAIEYVHRFGIDYPGGVFWIDAEQGISTMIGHITTETGIEVDNRLEEKEQLMQLWKQLSQSPHSLVVLDNFPEDEPLQPWLPSEGSIHLLVTTRRRDLDYARLSLEFMDKAEGIALLSKGKRKFGLEAGELVETLGGLPLALELSRNFLNSRPTLTIEELLKEIKNMGEMEALDIFAKEYKDQLPTGHKKAVSATIKMSWDLASPTAKSILQAISLLAPTAIPRRLLKDILDKPSENALEDPFEDGLSELSIKLSLVELDEEEDPWAHRLVAGFVRTTVEEDSPLRQAVVRAVRDEMSRTRDNADTESFRLLEKVLPHAEVISSSDFTSAEDAVNILNYLSWHNSKWGRYRLSERYGREALDLSIKDQSEGISVSQSYLALVLQDLGEYEEARDLLREALASDMKRYEQGHPEIASTQSNLGLALKGLDELKEAQELLREALASDMKSFKQGHPKIAIRQSNLALVLIDLGELEEARDLLREALAYNIKNYEQGHPYIAIAQSNLAIVLKDLGELNEAQELLREVLASKMKSYEQGHPGIAITQTNLAGVLKNLGELEEARTLAKEAYETFIKALGPEHPHTKTAKTYCEST